MWLSACIDVIFVLFALVSIGSGSPLVVHEKRDLPIRSAVDRRRIEDDALLPMRIGLRQNQNAALKAEDWLMDVSHPDSANYGRHWTQEEVIEAFKPSEETIRNVTYWLSGHSVFEFTHSDNKMWFAFDMPAEKAESMLQTEYFEHMTKDGDFEVSCDSYHLPAHLQAHIDYITPGVVSSEITGRTARSRLHRKNVAKRGWEKICEHSQKHPYKPPPYTSSTSLANCDKQVTPACIRALYNFSAPDPSLPIHPNNSLGIFEAQDGLWYQAELDAFNHLFAPNIPNGTSPILARIDGDYYPPNKTCIKAYKRDSDETELDIQVAVPIIYPQNVTVFAVEEKHPFERPLSRENYFNRFLSAVDGSYCTYEQQNNSMHGGKPQCGTLKPPNVISYSWSSPEHQYSYYWQKRQCNEHLKLGLQGVSFFIDSQDEGVGALGMWTDRGLCYHYNGTGHRVFMPFFPTSCPWVTSVGATQIHRNNSVYDTEVAAQWGGFYNHTPAWAGASGGGFSLGFDAPQYQKNAVSSYFKNHNPQWPYFENGHYWNSTGRYNRNGRGYPDISAVGSKVAVYWSFGYYEAYGTSASTPLVAALFNRIIEERLRAGKGRLGFVNPTLYKHPEMLNDIVAGGNGYCGPDEGFYAVPGWDPVTGLGTPNYPKMLDVFMKLP